MPIDTRALLTGNIEELEAQFLEWAEQNPEAYRALLEKIKAAYEAYREQHKTLREIFTAPPAKPVLLRLPGTSEENFTTTYSGDEKPRWRDFAPPPLPRLEFKTRPHYNPKISRVYEDTIYHRFGFTQPWLPIYDCTAAPTLNELRADLIGLLDFRIAQKG